MKLLIVHKNCTFNVIFKLWTGNELRLDNCKVWDKGTAKQFAGENDYTCC